ncbi:MAG: hypothetical protein ACI86M_001455 [Saprospiraceae bacterium]|jgi:hypothetical protein
MNLLRITTLLLLVVGIQFYSTKDYHITSSQGSSITIQNLSKKWKLDKYKVSFFSEDPAQNEKDDYINLKSDLTFESISEGEFGVGSWRLNGKKKRIYLSKENEEGEIVFIIDKLRTKKLILIIDDPSDSDAQYLKIHFKI